MFRQCSSFQKISATLLLSLSIGAGGLYLYQKSQEPKIPVKQVSLTEVVQMYYPECWQEMLAIYEASGVTPLISHALETRSEDTLTILNNTLQKIFLRPKNMERHQLNDAMYLRIIEDRLKAEYQLAGLKTLPVVNAPKLRELLFQPNIWAMPKPDKPIEADVTLLFGSSYPEYFERQKYFFDARKNKIIELIPDNTGKAPVFLLGGARDLDPLIDQPIMNRAKDEQEMLNVLFEDALKEDQSGLIPLYAIASNSAKENNNRPTTAGTLDSFIEMGELKDSQKDHRILAISSAPFIRYQHLVTYRQFLKHGLNMDNIHLTTLGPDMTEQIKNQPAIAQFAENALIAICLDNLAREVYELKTIERLKNELHQKPSFKI